MLRPPGRVKQRRITLDSEAETPNLAVFLETLSVHDRDMPVLFQSTMLINKDSGKSRSIDQLLQEPKSNWGFSDIDIRHPSRSI
jgi:hypothetical protein